MSVSFVGTFRDEPEHRIRDALMAAGASAVDAEFVIAAPLADHAVVRRAAAGAKLEVQVIDNPSGERSAGLNAAARYASGDFLVRFDARSLVPRDYVRRLIRRLDDPHIGVVGGHQVPVAGDGRRSRGIARGLAHPWLLGGAAYRRQDASGPVDTVYLGAFRRRELLALGGWDERLSANEDFDLCQRYRDAGLTVFLEPGVDVAYEPRDRVLSIWKQYRAFGISKVAYWRLTGRRANGRQVAALGGAVGSLAVSVSSARIFGPRAAGVVAAIAIVVVDHLADPRERDAVVRAYSILTECAAVAGWVSGVAAGAATITRSRASAPGRPSTTPWSRRRP